MHCIKPYFYVSLGGKDLREILSIKEKISTLLEDRSLGH